MSKKIQGLHPVSQDSREHVRIGRRRLLRGSAAAAASLLLTGLARAGAPEEDDFFQRWQGLASRLLEDAEMDQEEYTRELCRDIGRLSLEAMPRRSEIGFEREGLQTGLAWKEGAVFIVEVTLAPGGVVRPHNHPSHGSISVGLTGECVYEHYEIHGTAPAAEAGTPPFTVRQTRSGILEPGRISELTQNRDNIHTFRAGEEGATILDFLTTVGNPNSGFSVLDIDAEPKDSRRRLYDARWIGNPYR